MSSGRLAGKLCVVTGATSGLGRAAALRMAGEGAVIVGTGRNADQGARTVELITEAGGQAEFRRQDVTVEADWQALVEQCLARHGRIDVLVNNAGGFFVRPLDETPLEEFQRLWRINVESVFLGTRAALAVMAGQPEGGAIINMSSLAGQVGLDQAAAYCASKAAVTQFSRAAAVEAAALNPRVRVNSLNPGVILTEMITGSYGDSEELQQYFAKDNALKMMGLPEHVADAVVYLAADESRHVTGIALSVDGGRGADFRDK
ncbi:MAG: glucose 1-dehydrogenase [Gammaproteobacteria bacterium]|nr:glucose 1-dehydrogenase [Gammaproteobacteria bacterium]TVQ45736.1 MAG: glucose 1-dehydrogenase [Gammaproteobacteria bacterium]